VRRRSPSGNRPFRLPGPQRRRETRFHLLHVEPDGRVSRLRLSDKGSCVRPWEGVSEGCQPDQPERPIQVLIGELRDCPSPHLVLTTQPPAELIASVGIHRSVGLAHRPQTGVIRPAAQQAVAPCFRKYVVPPKFELREFTEAGRPLHIQASHVDADLLTITAI